MPVLDVRNLSTYFFTRSGTLKAVNGISFCLEAGDALGLAGESASGKTTTALSIMRLIRPPGRIVEGKILFNDYDLIQAPLEKIREIRWKEISIIFQGAMNALNPVMSVGDQIAESIVAHESHAKQDVTDRVSKLLRLVGIDESRYKSYPHELSGGMKQRVMIAMSLSLDPKVVIADEPTTALDVIVQAQILKKIKEIQQKRNLSMILITHDLSIIANVCNRVAIMYAGKIVESGPVKAIFKNPMHPYTKGLLNSVPSLEGDKRNLVSIPGSPPDLTNPPRGCSFVPRCACNKERCVKEEPCMCEVEAQHFVACHLTHCGK
jgi:peptide/nickel transport system ATP-binding protein